MSHTNSVNNKNQFTTQSSKSGKKRQKNEEGVKMKAVNGEKRAIEKAEVCVCE